MPSIKFGVLVMVMGMAHAGIVHQQHGHRHVATSTQNSVSHQFNYAHHGDNHGRQGYQYSVSHGVGHQGGGTVSNEIEGGIGAQEFDQGYPGGAVGQGIEHRIGSGVIAQDISGGIGPGIAAEISDGFGSYGGDIGTHTDAAGCSGAKIGADFGGFTGGTVIDSNDIGAFSAGANLGTQSGAFDDARSGSFIGAGIGSQAIGGNSGPYPAATPAQAYGVPKH